MTISIFLFLIENKFFLSSMLNLLSYGNMYSAISDFLIIRETCHMVKDISQGLISGMLQGVFEFAALLY